MERILAFGLLILSIAIFSQAVSAQEFYAVSNKEILPAVVVQPNSPLKIEKFTVVKGKDGRFTSVYTVRNVSSKKITEYQVARWYDNNTGYVEHGVMPKANVLLPDQTAGTFDPIKIVKADAPAGHEKLLRIEFIMVVNVIFDDGTKFSAQDVFDGFEEYLSKFQWIDRDDR